MNQFQTERITQSSTLAVSDVLQILDAYAEDPGLDSVDDLIEGLYRQQGVLWTSWNNKRKLAGFVLAITYADHTDLSEVQTVTRFRRRGVATALLQQIQAASGLPVFLTVRDNNEAALALYTRLGFTETQRYRHYYAPNTDGIRMCWTPSESKRSTKR